MASLTHVEAIRRSAVLDVRSYRVDLDLTTGPDVFASRTAISFDATPGAETFLDIAPAALHSVQLNGRALDVAGLTDGRLTLTGLAASNELVVVADMAYSHECEGLHRFVDPADGAVYVYAFVYIDNAPKVFACFDQPDLKAPYVFTLTTSEGWNVLGNSDAIEVAPGRWELAESPPLATYLTTVVAGPYVSFRREHDGVPLGLHCRASRAADLAADLDEVFEVTGACLDEYHRLFGVRYPFGKFDQVFVPEFSVLSLDHPGCVLLRELYLFGSAVPASERETRAVVIAHGLSLMWLAGLVTNRWWDDLWFGQAFADYLAHRVTGDVTRFRGPLTTFAVRRKAQAYVADQRPSTHPVALDGPDVQSVLLDLDRISYFKGSSALRQLTARVGTDALRAGLQTYFARHAYSSATFADFLGALSEAVGSDLSEWAELWLRRPDVNTLRPELTVSNGLITAAVIHQDPPERNPVLRPHTVHIGLYGAAEGPATVRVAIEGARTEVPELVGRPAPQLMLLNEDDLTYAKVRFDEQSWAALPVELPRLSGLNRAMIWCSLLMAVQDGVFPAEDHLNLVSRMLAQEPELSIIVEVLEHARDDVAGRYLVPRLRAAATGRLAASLRRRITTTPPGDERLIALARGLLDFSSDPDELRAWLDGDLPDGLQLDEDLAWRARYRLATLGELSGAQIAAALSAQPSAHAEQAAAKARAARPDPAAKAAAWTAIMTDSNLSSYQRWSLAEGFWQPDQLDLTEPYVERFFLEMPEAARLHGDLALDLLVRFLYPRFAASQETLSLAEKLLTRDDIPVPLRRRVADATDDLRRVVAVRELAP